MSQERAGKIERAIRELFATQPDEAFTTNDLCWACYPALRDKPPWEVERKHRVAVVRAAEKMLAGNPDWRIQRTWERGNMLIYFNAASVPSVAMAETLRHGTYMRREAVMETTREKLDPPKSWGKWGPEGKANFERRVSQHIAMRDADPAEAERLRAEQETARVARLAAASQGILSLRKHSQVLSDPQRFPSDNISALAAKARALVVANDPDVVRTELEEIADALESLSITPS